MRGHTVDPDQRPEREVEGVERRVVGIRDLHAFEDIPDRVDEEFAVGDRVRLEVVVERVAPEPVSVVAGLVGGGPPPVHVHQADHQAERADPTQPERERARRRGCRSARARLVDVDGIGEAGLGGRGHAVTSAGSSATAGSTGAVVGSGSRATPPVSPEGVERDRHEQRRHRVERGAIPGDRESEHDRERDRDDDGDEGIDRDPTSSQHHEAADRERDHHVVADERRPRRLMAALLEELVELDVLHGAEDLPDPAEAGEQHDGKTVCVILDVGAALVECLLVEDRLLDPRRVLTETPVFPVAEHRTRVGRIAVAVGQHQPESRTEHRPFFERREVPDDPRPDDQHADGGHHAEHAEPLPPVPRAHEQRGRHADEGEQDDALGPGERRQGQRHRDRHRAPHAGRPPEAVDGDEREHDEEAVEGLEADDGVVRPERRVRRREQRGQQPHPVARQPPGQQADQHDRAGAEERGRQPMLGGRVEAQRGRDRQEDGVERWVQGGGLAHVLVVQQERVREPAALDEVAGLPVVEELVAGEPADPVGHGPEHVPDPPRRGSDPDQRQSGEEPP